MSIGYPGADREGFVTVEEHASPEQIEEYVKDDAFNFLELYWEEDYE